MANFDIPSMPVYRNLMRRLDAMDPGHADVFNTLYGQLLENGEYLKQQIETQTISITEKGAADGVAELDATGKVPEAQLPTLGLSEEDVEALINAGQDLIFTNVSVPAAGWTATNDYTYSKYETTVSLAGVTSAMDAEVFFAPNDADSGIFSGAGIVNDGSITLLAIKQPTENITIPKIRFMKGANA